MILEHLRLRHLVPLLAAGALAGEERGRVASHLGRCARCRGEHEAVQTLMAGLEKDPLRAEVREAAAPLPLPVLLERVERRIEESLRAPRPVASRGWRRGLPAAALAALVLALVLPRLASRGPGLAPAPSSTPSVSEDALDRLERNVAREQAARYLGDAQDVLATVAASPRDCDRKERRVDVEAESRRSRELLARRALLLDVDGPAVASAQPVLDDVEDILREVAAMESCARFRDVVRLQGEIERRQLLMKVRLMQRELLG